MRFLRNQWYVAARSDEIGRKPLGRTICDERIVLFRRGSGTIAALEDRCAHRMAPLSLGDVVGDDIQCSYHGVRFRGDGACTIVPSQQDLPIPREFCVRSYAVHEAFSLIFVWIGDAEKAEPTLIPEWMSRNTDAGWTAVHGYRHVRGHYQLVIDNLLDLSHVTYTHKTTLAGPGIDETPMDVEIDGDVVRTSRVMRNVDPPPIQRITKGLTGKIDRWQLSEFRAPIYILVTLGAEPAGTSDKLQVPSHLVINSATPETETTTHYFWSSTRCLRTDDAELSRKFRELTEVAIEEDVLIIEAQQRVISSAPPGAALVNFRGDSGGVAARRIVRRKLDRDAKSVAAA